MKTCIGGVLFTCEELGWDEGPMGDERVALLRAFYRKENLHGWIPIAINPFRKLTHEDVNWNTAGKGVTE